MNLDIENIEKVKKRYLLAKEILDSNYKEIESHQNVSSFPNTIKVLLRMIDKIESIKYSLEILVELEELYSCHILLRSLIEHKIVSHYIWIKFDIDSSDECASSYYKEYLLSESIKQEGYKLKVEGIKNNVQNNNNFENLKLRVGYLNDKEQRDLEEIHKKGNSFLIAKIANYLNNSIPEDHPLMPYNKKVIIDDLLHFNKFSSFVHGGPDSENHIFLDYNNKKKEKDKRMMNYLSMHSSRTVIIMLIHVVSIEVDRYKEILKKIVTFDQV